MQACSIVCLPPDGLLPLFGKSPELKIGNNTYIGRYSQISCGNKIHIGKNVLISDRVFIADVSHGFDNPSIPIRYQALFTPGPVEIGDGTWIGAGACILPNVVIGSNCVVGANAVVTSNIPDFHIAVGVPARFFRRVSSPLKNY